MGIIHKYFSNNFSKPVREKFKWWVVNSKNADIEEEFKSIWQESPSQITEDTRIEFRRLKNRIKEHEQSKTSVSRRMTIAASIVIAASLGATITYFISEHRVNRILTDNELFQISVPNGESYATNLPDGSKVTLAAGSTLISPRSFGNGKRTLFLSGKALFEVKKDERHPFIVNTRDWSVTALGTIFDVDAYPDSKISSSTLKEGRIKVTINKLRDNTMAEEYYIFPNQQLIYDKDTKAVSISDVIADQKMSWTKGYQIFEKSSFSEIISALEKIYGVRIVCNDIEKITGSFNVKFFPNESITDVLEILHNVNCSFTYTNVNGTIYINVE
ncbi:MAG: FecR domain-containing protein [Bacteroidales bacterium]|nr:FecR domain-containing protein [Bacteroidales bacterium]